MPLLPYYLEVILTHRMACVVATMMYREWFLQMLFESFSKGPGGFAYVFIITGKFTKLEPVYGPTFVVHGVFVLGWDQQVFDGTVTFEVGLYTIPPTDHFDTFAKALGVRYYYVTLSFDFKWLQIEHLWCPGCQPHHWPCPKPICSIYNWWEPS